MWALDLGLESSYDNWNNGFRLVEFVIVAATAAILMVLVCGL